MAEAQSYYYATGKRKNAVAKIWLVHGQGNITINNRTFEEYFPRETWRMHALEPLEVTNSRDKYDIKISVLGGGLTGQSGAVRHGLARALHKANETLKATLKSAGMFTRDSRMVESKKYGKKKARRGQQFSKR